MPLTPGSRLGPYEILAPLGAGGMGEVYRARDPRLGREVAIKVLSEQLAADPEALARFEREARAVAALSHPNILAIHDFGKHGDIAYAVTELLEGKTLRGRLDAGPLSQNEVVSYALQVVRGLSAAHDKGIVHRDLKPENIFITSDNQVKILDFGLVKRVTAIPEGEETSAPTVTGQTTPGLVMGTLSYMSPEQVKGLPVDHRSDLFSFGAVLYEMVTRERPFRGNSAVAVADAILHAEPRNLAESRVPHKLKSIIRKLLEKDPAKRFATAADVGSDLKAVEAQFAPNQGVLTRTSWIAVAAAAVAIATLGGWLWYRSSRQRWALDTAAPEIARLIEANRFANAVALARDARAILPRDPTLEKLWLSATREVTIETTPPGAEVEIRPYTGDPNTWVSLGRTPLQKVRVARGAYVWRITKQGFAPTAFISIGRAEWIIKLPAQQSAPPGMVFVPVVSETSLPTPFLAAPSVRLEDYFIDQHEVTNEDYKKFVDAGGYQKRELWKQPFQRNGRQIPWEEAVSLLRDATGRPGPATWEAGSFGRGLEKHPVAGVSWYEAAAYAEFAGKSLPTAYHWVYAAEIYFANLINPGSNSRGAGTQPVGGAGTLSGFGTTDMAGNVKEWCWNESSDGKRFILGGGFGEPAYMFQEGDAQSPWERRPNFGFRCGVYFPGAEAVEEEKFSDSRLEEEGIGFLTESGRAILFPIYKGTYERRDGYTFRDAALRKTLWRDHLIMWSKDMGRSLDYLLTRKDIDNTRLAYRGFSWGAAVGPVLLAGDDRFKAAILVSGGFYAWSNPPEADPFNFVTRVNIPTLMLSDRYDLFFTLEASQLPFFRLLGSAEAEKRRVVYDSGHGGLPYRDNIRESLDWLDKYLGPVKRKGPGP